MHIGVFGNQGSWYVNELCRRGLEHGHVMWPLQFEDFLSRVSNHGIELRCGEYNVRDCDVVLIRTMPPGSLEQVVARMDLLAGLEASGTSVVNSPRALECAVDKYLTTQRLALAGLPVPETVVCENSDTALDAFEMLGRDVVVKPLFGAEGRGIIRVSDPELALRAFRTLERLGSVLYVQRFLKGPGFDIRVLLLDGQLVGSMKRIPKEGDFRANISQQGTGVPHRPSDKEMELAVAAATATGCRFAGVDLMYDGDLQPYVIEVNAVPGWRGLERACGVDVPETLFCWLENI